MNEELGMRKERTTGLLDKLKLLAEASKIGDFDITINCAGLSGEETELICLINEAVGNYRAAVEYDLMKYKLTSDALGIALWDMDVVSGDPVNPNNKFTWSQEFRFMLGYSDEHDFPNILSSWSDKLHPEDKERTLNAFAAHLNDYTGKIPYDIEYRLLLKNGQYRYFRAFGTTLRNSVGIPLRVAGAVMDINEKKQTENQLMITSSIIQNSPNIAFYKKISGEIIYVNPSGSIITGYTHDELMDDGLNRLFDDEETVKYFANKGASDSRANIIRNEVNAKMQNNELRTFATTSFLVDNDAYATVASDITDAKKSELERLEALKELQHSKETAETLVEIRTKDLNRQQSLMNTVNIAAAILLEPNTDDGLKAISSTMEMVCQSVDADRVFLWQNINRDGILHYKQVCKWMRSEYAMGDALLEYTYDEAMPQWKNMLFDGGIINGPLDNLPGYNPASFSMYALQSILIIPLFLKGEFWGFVSFDDCRHRRSFPEAEIYALSSYGLLVVGAIQRNKIMHDLQVAIEDAKKASLAKSRFIANMNHEMRTPMNAIVGLTDLLLEETGVSDNVKKSLKKIGTAGNTLMGLINDVLDISKIEAGKLDLTSVQYDVPSLLNDIITLNLIRIANKPVTFKLDINEDLPCTLFGDDLRIKQILNNLLSNAFKYTKEGTVTFGVSCQRKGDSEWVSFYVSDTGIGIRADDIDKLFSDFNQVDTSAHREIEGTGLGLSITKKLVELMEGKISVESEYGKGTTFSVRIRQGFVANKTIGKKTEENLRGFRYADKKMVAQKKLMRTNLRNVRVLVVDDFQTNLDVAAGMLRKYKMQVDCVDNGQDAVDRISVGMPVYDAIFMDHMMPGLDGIEATKLIRALGTKYAENIPIIALTANAVAGNEKMFLDNGFNAFLPKPFNVMSLDSVIQKWVKK